jgi:multimeric flavodoxin WrbA
MYNITWPKNSEVNIKMKVTVINGNARRGSTWHVKEELLAALGNCGEVEATEFTLPKDMPCFCRGCFTCFLKGEDKCPDSGFIGPIVAAMEEADVIVMTSPVYALDVSGELKALLDHLCFMWVSHRPNAKMFKKVGVTVSTTAGMGLRHATKTMKNSLNFWGVKRIFPIKQMVAASKWDEVTEKARNRISKAAAKTAKRAAAAVRNDRAAHRLFFRLLFRLMRGMHKKNEWSRRDKEHWETRGWLSGVNPLK